jgi:hypothetical protein
VREANEVKTTCAIDGNYRISRFWDSAVLEPLAGVLEIKEAALLSPAPSAGSHHRCDPTSPATGCVKSWPLADGAEGFSQLSSWAGAACYLCIWKCNLEELCSLHFARARLFTQPGKPGEVAEQRCRETFV